MLLILKGKLNSMVFFRNVCDMINDIFAYLLVVPVFEILIRVAIAVMKVVRASHGFSFTILM